MKVLASSQADVGARDTSSKSKGEIITGSFGLTSVRTALVEWSINLGGLYPTHSILNHIEVAHISPLYFKCLNVSLL